MPRRCFFCGTEEGVDRVVGARSNFYLCDADQCNKECQEMDRDADEQARIDAEADEFDRYR